jgi:hypothetical protein
MDPPPARSTILPRAFGPITASGSWAVALCLAAFLRSSVIRELFDVMVREGVGF